MNPLCKNFVAYIVGVITTALAVSMGCGRWGAINYALGVLSTLLVCGYILSRPWCARPASRLLGMVGRPQKRAAKAPSASKRETDPARELNPNSGIVRETILALRGLNCDPQTARRAALDAAQRLPGAELPQVLKLALNIATARA